MSSRLAGLSAHGANVRDGQIVLVGADCSRACRQQATAATHIEPEVIADVIAFAVSRPQRVALSEILVRPTAQAL